MPTLSSAMSTAVGRRITEPGLFIEIQFSTIVRLSTRGTTTWNALTWTQSNVKAENIEMSMNIVQALSLRFGDADNSIAAFLLNANPTGLGVKVWVFDASAIAAADPVLIFDGQIDASDGGASRDVTISCRVVTKYLPNGELSLVLPAYFFAPEGVPLRWGNGTISMNRRQEYA